MLSTDNMLFADYMLYADNMLSAHKITLSDIMSSFDNTLSADNMLSFFVLKTSQTQLLFGIPRKAEFYAKIYFHSAEFRGIPGKFRLLIPPNSLSLLYTFPCRHYKVNDINFCGRWSWILPKGPDPTRPCQDPDLGKCWYMPLYSTVDPPGEGMDGQVQKYYLDFSENSVIQIDRSKNSVIHVDRSENSVINIIVPFNLCDWRNIPSSLCFAPASSMFFLNSDLHPQSKIPSTMHVPKRGIGMRYDHANDKL
jgi:hypothetical protein